MTEKLLAELLAAVRDRGLEVEDAVERLRGFPVDVAVDGARVDTHRNLRTGVAEVVFCPGKTAQQAAGILSRLYDHHGRALGTRATPEFARQVRERIPEASYDPVSRLLTLGRRSAGTRSGVQPPERGGAGGGAATGRLDHNGTRTASAAEAGVDHAAGGPMRAGACAAHGCLPRGAGHPQHSPGGEFPEHPSAGHRWAAAGGEGDRGRQSAASELAERGAEHGEADGGSGPLVAVVTAGTSDLPVAEEAAQTLEFLGGRVERFYDVGVAGLHRLLAVRPQLERAAVVICVAGMEGALTSVVGGLLAAPVIGVPTSVGYGAHLGGAAPLLAMLNSCAAGVAVVNIDNGFGAALMAHAIIRQIGGAASDPAASARRPGRADDQAPAGAHDRRSRPAAQERSNSPVSGRQSSAGQAPASVAELRPDAGATPAGSS